MKDDVDKVQIGQLVQTHVYKWDSFIQMRF